ncbi:MAG: cytochrome c biogenesis protein CcsA [Desulfovibrionaceae bacterium]|nr:cytochrome c biogenesis protein CcsA [Desulfovibrionaceae bacterium]
MNWIESCSLIALLGYVTASVAAVAGLLGRSARVRAVAFGLTGVSFAMHSLLLLGALTAQAESSRLAYLIPFAWCIVAAGLLLRWKLRLDIILVFVAPLAFVLLFIAQVLHSANTALPETLRGPIFFLHLGGVFIGVGLMAVAAGAAAIFLWQERAIKSKSPLSGFRRELPALGALDRINALATAIGFPCYTMGVLCGFVWGRIVWKTLISGDPKELMSLAIWAVYALLFHQRQALGWRGRKPAIMALCIFLASLFSLFAVNLFLPTHHSFATYI